MAHRAMVVLLIGAVTACGQLSNEPVVLVGSLRSAVPSSQQLSAVEVPDTPSNAVGDPAFYPNASKDIVLGVNSTVMFLVALLKGISDLPPTFTDVDTRTAVWGPWEWEDGIGKGALVIQQNAPDDDFEYTYFLARGMTDDIEQMTPIVFGGATPDRDRGDHKAGISVWDFDASNAFDAANDPMYDPLNEDHGKLVFVYGRGPDENNPDNEFATVVAAFRNWIGKGDYTVGNTGGSIDYFYGRFTEGATSTVVDFVDYIFDLDIAPEGAPDGNLETLEVRLALVNSGFGRAEATASGGTIPAGDRWEVAECWDENVEQTAFGIQLVQANGTEVPMGSYGSCQPPFDQELTALQIPRLSDIPQEHRDGIDCLATNGKDSLDGRCF